METIPKKIKTAVTSEKHLSSSILLWMRSDKPREAGMDRWKGPHARIISANKGLWEYRQIHFTEQNPGLWQPIDGVETTIPTNRKIDGVADVTLKNIFSIFRGKEQNRLAHADEVNLFQRTILYVAFPKNSRWYHVATPTEAISARSMVFFRRKEGVSDQVFAAFFNKELVPSLANMGVLKELRSKVYNPWNPQQWDTPNVAHDNPVDVQFQASLIIGFENETSLQNFFEHEALKHLSERLVLFCSAIHAYRVSETLTFVKDGKEQIQ